MGEQEQEQEPGQEKEQEKEKERRELWRLWAGRVRKPRGGGLREWSSASRGRGGVPRLSLLYFPCACVCVCVCVCVCHCARCARPCSCPPLPVDVSWQETALED